MIKYIRDEYITLDEYLDFLRRSNLGNRYPKERYQERVSHLLENRSISITARDKDNLLVGICFGLTDFTYFLFISDLGVDRNYERMGIGKEVIQNEAGAENDITVVTVANGNATEFYEKNGFNNDVNTLWWKPGKALAQKKGK